MGGLWVDRMCPGLSGPKTGTFNCIVKIEYEYWNCYISFFLSKCRTWNSIKNDIELQYRKKCQDIVFSILQNSFLRHKGFLKWMIQYNTVYWISMIQICTPKWFFVDFYLSMNRIHNGISMVAYRKLSVLKKNIVFYAK